MAIKWDKTPEGYKGGAFAITRVRKGIRRWQVWRNGIPYTAHRTLRDAKRAAERMRHWRM